MLLDIAKYLATVGLLGAFLVDKLTANLGILMAAVTLATFVIGFYVIPPKNEGDES